MPDQNKETCADMFCKKDCEGQLGQIGGGSILRKMAGYFFGSYFYTKGIVVSVCMKVGWAFYIEYIHRGR